MAQQHLEKLSQKIQSYVDVWRSLRVVCFAVRQGNIWLNLAVRVSLRELIGEAPRFLRPVPDFLVSIRDVPVREIDRVLSALIDGYISTEVEGTGIKVYLGREAAGLSQGSNGPVIWFGPLERQRQSSLPEYGTRKPAIALTALGEQVRELLPPELQKAVESKLRSLETPYDGLGALVATWVPGVKLSESDRAPMQIVAPIPFDLDCTQTGLVIVKSPVAASNGDLSLRVFFRPEGCGPLEKILADGACNDADGQLFNWQKPIEWPQGSVGAKLVLFFRGEEVDALEVRRWPQSGTLRVAIDTFFDPEHKRLREAILGQSGKENLAFENAVVRLFNLLGVPMVWYGKGAMDARPDLAAGLFVDSDTRIIVLGECTRESPSAKFSALAERARELREAYGTEAEVLPVVFTRTATTNSESNEAAERHICLVGREECEILLRVLGEAVEPSEVIQYLRTLRPPYFAGLDLPQRWPFARHPQ
jgi:hypothetical protein